VASVYLQTATLDQYLNRETNDVTGATSRINAHKFSSIVSVLSTLPGGGYETTGSLAPGAPCGPRVGRGGFVCCSANLLLED
jgi:hypothetical protein